MGVKKTENLYEVDLTELTHSFQDACSNKDFKNFVYGLNLKEETLMKYTSSLEDAFEEWNNCQNCKSLATCKNKVNGYCYTPIGKDKVINFSYDACEKL